jgi:hypothetical protein
MYEIDDFIGKKVIVRNNHWEESYKIGVLAGFSEHHSGSAMPIVNMDGKEYLCMACLLPWSSELEQAMEAFQPKEQWDFMVKIRHYILGETRRCHGNIKHY